MNFYGVSLLSNNTTLKYIIQLSRTSYPLCMRQLHTAMKENHHLKHFGRLQYGLFIKVGNPFIKCDSRVLSFHVGCQQSRVVAKLLPRKVVVILDNLLATAANNPR